MVDRGRHTSTHNLTEERVSGKRGIPLWTHDSCSIHDSCSWLSRKKLFFCFHQEFIFISGLGGESSTDGWASPPPPPAAPVPPPPPPPIGAISQKTVKPTKPAIKPRVKMRPLFWNRIILDHEEDEKLGQSPESPSSVPLEQELLYRTKSSTE